MTTWVQVSLLAVVVVTVGLWVWMTPGERLSVLDGVKQADPDAVQGAASHATWRLAEEGKDRAKAELVEMADDALDAVKQEMHAAVEDAAAAAGDRVREKLGVDGDRSGKGALGQEGVDHRLHPAPVVGQSGG